MNHQQFTAKKTGEICRFTNLQTGRDDWLFVPNELPADWAIPERLWPLLVEAREALGQLNGVGQTLSDPNLLLRPLQTREAITASAIEGTYVTPQQLLLYELDPREPSTSEGQVADWKEVSNYGAAMTLGRDLLAELPICGRLIRRMHETLMAGVRGAAKQPGRYRDIQVQVGATGRYIPPPPAEIDRLMANLERFIHGEPETLDPLVRCCFVHYQFEAIHPFMDGNGRVGRALFALMASHLLGHSKPWLYLSPYFERNKEEYYDNLLRVSTHGDWDRWVEFCIHGTIVQAKDAIRRCEEFHRIRADYHSRIDAPSPRTHAIIEMLFITPVLTIPQVRDRLGVEYHTARKDLERLVGANILVETLDSHPRSFYADEVMRVAFGEG